MLCVTAFHSSPYENPYTLYRIIFENLLGEVSKQLNVHMVESHLNTTLVILCGDLNLTSVDWNTSSSDEQREFSFLKSIAKFKLRLLTDSDFFTMRSVINRQSFFMY